MDKDLLYYHMSKKGINCQQMCSKLGMSRSAFHRKCTGTSEFTRSEIQKIMDILDLDSPMGVFFAEKAS